MRNLGTPARGGLRGDRSGEPHVPHAVVVIPGSEAGPEGEWVPVLVPFDLAELAALLGIATGDVTGDVLAVVTDGDGIQQAIPSQFDPESILQGTLTLLLPAELAGVERRVRVFFTDRRPVLPGPQSPFGLAASVTDDACWVTNGFAAVHHTRGLYGSLPDVLEVYGPGGVQDGPILEAQADDDFVLGDGLIPAGTPGGYVLRNDVDADLQVVEGQQPLRIAVRVEARYLDQTQDRPDTAPRATYEFSYFAGSPVVHVRAVLHQDRPSPWSPTSFLWFRFHDAPGALFDGWVHGGLAPADPVVEHDIVPGDDYLDGQSPQTAPFTSDRALWAALRNRATGAHLAYLGLGNALLHDYWTNAPDVGDPDTAESTYLRGPWFRWSGIERRVDSALWLGHVDGDPEPIRRAAAQFRAAAAAYVTVEPFEELVDEVESAVIPGDAAAGWRYRWVASQARDLVRRQARLAEAYTIVSAAAQARAAGADVDTAVGWFDGTDPDRLFVDNGRIGLGFQFDRAPAPPHHLHVSGVSLVSLFDLETGHELLCGQPQSIWDLDLTVDGGESLESCGLVSDAGWGLVEAEVLDTPDGKAVELTWSAPLDPRLDGLGVRATVVLDGMLTRWRMTVDNEGEATLRHVRFPQAWAGPTDDAPEDHLLVPYESGRAVPGPLLDPEGARYVQTYPSGRCCIQMMARYGEPTGLYVATHDPVASIKELSAEQGQLERAPLDGLQMVFDWPAEHQDEPGNGFLMTPTVWDPQSGSPVSVGMEAVLGVFHGDWYDAASVYRSWAPRALWWPRPGVAPWVAPPPGLRDVGLWLHWNVQNPVSAGAGFAPADASDVVALAQEMGGADGYRVASLVYHWMEFSQPTTWPFHFPERQNLFDVTLPTLAAGGVSSVPYVNGRLVYDLNYLNDNPNYQVLGPAYELSPDEQEMFPALQEGFDSGDLLDGVHNAGYSEIWAACPDDQTCDGYRTYVLCPTTDDWEEKLTLNVGNPLLGYDEQGVTGLYLDQVAASEPTPCFNPSHTHPKGGGHWWTAGGYWNLLRDLRIGAFDRGQALLTESAAEPYLHLFDGYFVWQWGDRHEVPLFTAIYGDQITRFGRTYYASPDLQGVLAKAGQSLAWGEQVGMLKPQDTSGGSVAVVEDASGTGIHLSNRISDVQWRSVVKPYLQRLARARIRFRDHLDGEMARPPRLVWAPEQPAGLPFGTVTSNWGWNRMVTVDKVLAGAWSSGDGGLLIAVVNVVEGPSRVRLDFDGTEYGFDPGDTLWISIHVTEDDPAHPIPPITISSPATFTRLIEFDPLEVKMLVIRRGDATRPPRSPGGSNSGR